MCSRTAEKKVRQRPTPSRFTAPELYLCAVDPSPETERLYRVTELLLIEIAERARVAGVPLLVSLSPSIAQVQPAIWDRVVRSGESGEAELDRDLPQRRLEALGREHGFRVLDLTPALRAARERGEATYYMVEKHRTAAGNRVVAAALYEAIAADASLRTAAGIQESGREGPRGALDASAALP